MNPKDPCSICGGKWYRLTYCATHYMRYIKYGDPLKTHKPWGVKKPKKETS